LLERFFRRGKEVSEGKGGELQRRGTSGENAPDKKRGSMWKKKGRKSRIGEKTDM